MAETELERAERRFAQARARLQALRNREATRQRKLDTRRKVILGGALVDLAARDDAAAAMLDRLIRNLAREQDQAAFVGWDWRNVGSGDVEDAGAAGAGSDARADASSVPAQPGSRNAGGPQATSEQSAFGGSDSFGGSDTPAPSHGEPQAPGEAARPTPRPVRAVVDRLRDLQR